MTELAIGVVGLGYVGLPLACLFGRKHFNVVGYDINAEKLAAIANGYDPCGELEPNEILEANLSLTREPLRLRTCQVIIICVPTPVDENDAPNLDLLLAAATTVGKYMSKGTIVVFESTVFPGTTEGECALALQKTGLSRSDFCLGYSPERVNPGDKKHRTENIVKLVSGQDAETLETLMRIYGSIAPVHACPSIKVAEAAKLFENVQRDVNIAYVNEFTRYCEMDGISITDVLEAANTKWNALKFYPGLVGGDCIYTDPYYALAWTKKLQLSSSTSLIRAARVINKAMPNYVAHRLKSQVREGSSVLFLGLTFKENVRDCRNSGGLELMKIFSDRYEVHGYDPLAPVNDFRSPLWEELPPVDVIIVVQRHEIFKSLPLLSKLKNSGKIIDLKSLF